MRRRTLLSGALVFAALGRAQAKLALQSGKLTPDNSVAVAPEVHISYGQSWRSNAFFDFSTYSFPSTGNIALHVPSIGLPTLAPGVLPNSAGINIPSAPNGVTTCTLTDAFSIGRCAILAQQLYRIRAGQAVLVPILEFCAAYPASTWTSGGGGGLAPGGTSWTNQATIIADIQAMFPTGKYLATSFRSVGYTQAGAADNTLATKLTNLTDMLTDYDGLGLAGPALKYYLGLPAAISTATTYPDTNWGTYSFCRTNAPSAAGPWSGRCFGTSPSYAWKFNGSDNIHTDAYGTAKWGLAEGYARYLTQDVGIAWTPLWRSLTLPITSVGQVISVPFDRPPGTDFASSSMIWQSDANDGIKVWPQNGWNVKRSGSFLTVTPVIRGLYVDLTVSETITSGDVLEVSYAYYGPGGTNPGDNSGVGGNLCMAGPPDVLFSGQNLTAWAWPFYESITA